MSDLDLQKIELQKMNTKLKDLEFGMKVNFASINKQLETQSQYLLKLSQAITGNMIIKQAENIPKLGLNIEKTNLNENLQNNLQNELEEQKKFREQAQRVVPKNNQAEKIKEELYIYMGMLYNNENKKTVLGKELEEFFVRVKLLLLKNQINLTTVRPSIINNF